MASNGAINLLVSKEAQAQIDLLLKDLDQIEDKIINISRTGIGKKAGFVDVKTQKELAKALETNKKLSTELTQSRTELINVNKKLVGQANQEATAYETLNKSQKESINTYNSLITKRAMGNELSEEEVIALKEVETQIKKNQGAYKQIAAGQNKLGVSSKRTGVAFDSLGFSVAQLTRESPAFLNSVQTGFMALSNNIPIFVDEVDKLVKQNKVLKESGEQTKSVFKSVGKAFFSMQSLISIVILLITVLGPKLWEMAKGWWAAGDAMDRFKLAGEQANKVQEEGIKNSAREITNLKIMNKAVQDTTKTMGERNAILKTMRDKYGDDIKHLSDRQILTEGIGDAEKVLAKRILERAKADAAASLITENSIKLITLQQEARTIATQRYRLVLRQLRNEELGYYEAAQAQQVKINDLTDDLIDNGREQGALVESNNQLMETAITNTEDLGTASDDLNKKREKANSITAKAISMFSAEDTQIQDVIRTYNELADILSGDTDAFAKRQASLDIAGGFKAILEGETVALNIAQKEMKEYADSVKELPPQLQAVADALVNLENAQKKGVETQAHFQKMLSEATAIAMNSLSALADLGAGFTDSAISRLEMEMDAYNEKYELQKELIEKEIEDEESKNQRLAELDKEKRLKQKEIDKKIAQEKKKQAIIDRTAALFQIAIQTAVWATRVGAEASIFGIALQPLIWALGAVNAAAVLAQPMPKFKDGHLAGTYEGTAVINDGGNIEILERKGGQLEMSTAKNKIVSMQKGDKVHKDIPSFLNSLPNGSIMDSLHSASILSAVQMASAQSNMEKRIFDEQFKSAMLDTMAKGFGKAKIVNDNRSVGEAVREALAEQNYTKNFL